MKTDSNPEPDSKPANAQDSAGCAASNLFAFFRNLTSERSLNEGREYHAAGIILSRHNTQSESLKDLCVMYLDPFSGHVERAWRADGEIEIYPVDEWEWKSLKERYEAIERLCGPNRRP